MWYFRSPQIVFGEDSLEELGHLGATRALIVTDAVLRELGLTDQVTAHLSVDAIKVFADVEPEPSLQTTQRGADIACAFNPDLILAVGGGSVIDAAKAIVLLYENPGIDLEGIMPCMELAPERARFPYITIGRTSVYDWSTGDDSGSEHLVTLHVWSRARGKAEAHAIIEAAEQALRDFSPDLEGHRLVGLFREFAEVYFDVEMELQHGLLRYRALVEERAGAA